MQMQTFGSKHQTLGSPAIILACVEKANYVGYALIILSKVRWDY
jgi:hypothetical protein